MTERERLSGVDLDTGQQLGNDVAYFTSPAREEAGARVLLDASRAGRARSQTRAQRRANPTRGMGGLSSRSGTKRPNSKWKVLAKLADNIFHSTKAYRCS